LSILPALDSLWARRNLIYLLIVGFSSSFRPVCCQQSKSEAENKEPSYQVAYEKAEKAYATECGGASSDTCGQASTELHKKRVEAYLAARAELANHIREEDDKAGTANAQGVLSRPEYQGWAWELGYDSEKAEKPKQANFFYSSCVKILAGRGPKSTLPENIQMDGASVPVEEACSAGQLRTAPVPSSLAPPEPEPLPSNISGRSPSSTDEDRWCTCTTAQGQNGRLLVKSLDADAFHLNEIGSISSSETNITGTAPLVGAQPAGPAKHGTAPESGKQGLGGGETKPAKEEAEAQAKQARRDADAQAKQAKKDADAQTKQAKRDADAQAKQERKEAQSQAKSEKDSTKKEKVRTTSSDDKKE
jgi:hypothetical protein